MMTNPDIAAGQFKDQASVSCMSEMMGLDGQAQVLRQLPGCLDVLDGHIHGGECLLFDKHVAAAEEFGLAGVGRNIAAPQFVDKQFDDFVGIAPVQRGKGKKCHGQFLNDKRRILPAAPGERGSGKKENA